MGFTVPVPVKKRTFAKDTLHSSQSDALEDAVNAEADRKALATDQPLPPLNYEIPPWSASATQDHYFEILKGGTIIEKLRLKEKCEFLTIGRLPTCEVAMEHPSVSRYHAVIQFGNGDKSFVYDLGSIHGTWMNKKQLPPRKYVFLAAGSLLRFGESSRLYIFDADRAISEHPPTDRTSLSSPEYMLASIDYLLYDHRQVEGTEPGPRDGLPEDTSTVPFYFDAPKETLKRFLDHFNIEPSYEIGEDGPGHARVFKARILIESHVINSEEDIAGLGSASKKKDAEKEAAFDACQQLDRLGILTSILFGPSKRPSTLSRAEDDSDDDYYDRTKKGQSTAKDTLKSKANRIDSFETLSARRDALVGRIAALENMQSSDETPILSSDADSLDKFVEQISDEAPNTLQLLGALRKELNRVVKLLDLVRPSDNLLRLFHAQATRTVEKQSAHSLAFRDDTIAAAPLTLDSVRKDLGSEHDSRSSEEFSEEHPCSPKKRLKPQYEEDVEEWLPQ